MADNWRFCDKVVNWKKEGLTRVPQRETEQSPTSGNRFVHNPFHLVTSAATSPPP